MLIKPGMSCHGSHVIMREVTMVCKAIAARSGATLGVSEVDPEPYTNPSIRSLLSRYPRTVDNEHM